MLGAIAITSLALASCTLPYLHSPSLEKATAAASDTLPSEADALKPFDDQLTNMDTFAAQEDLSVARYWAGVRDGHLARLIALDQSARLGRLANQIDSRLICEVKPRAGGCEVRGG